MPLPPSRRDTVGPPPRDISDLSRVVRHHDSYLRQLDPGLLAGRFGTPRPVGPGPSQIVGGSEDGGEDDELAWEYDDRHAVTATGTQSAWLTYEPIEESLHVFWHPGGDGALRISSEFFAVVGQAVTIPDPGYFAVGDTFSFQYEYVIGDDVPEPALIGFTEPGATPTSTTVSFAMPVGTVAGTALVLSSRGAVGAGGGELLDSQSCSDPRMQLVYQATGVNSGHTIIESIWVGIADGSGAPIIVDVANTMYPSLESRGVLAAFSGVNGFTTVSAVETGSTTPVVDAVATVAVVWARTSGFAVVNAAQPSGYTDVSSSGTDYYSTDISWWYDPTGNTSPAGTFSGEGCCVIALT